jgi:hypothetical protein
MRIRAVGGVNGESMWRRLMWVSPKDSAPASWVPATFGCVDWVERRCRRFRVTLDFTRLKGRYMDLVESVDSGTCWTLSAGDVGYRNLARCGVDAMKLVVF